MKPKEATHTPGPWTNNDSYDSVRGADGEVVCHTFGAVDPVERLNAKLIAAAPELLRFAEMIRDSGFEYSDEKLKTLHDALDQVSGENKITRMEDEHRKAKEVGVCPECFSSPYCNC
jgi:hypothetical protein